MNRWIDFFSINTVRVVALLFLAVSYGICADTAQAVRDTRAAFIAALQAHDNFLKGGGTPTPSGGDASRHASILSAAINHWWKDLRVEDLNPGPSVHAEFVAVAGESSGGEGVSSQTWAHAIRRRGVQGQFRGSKIEVLAANNPCALFVRDANGKMPYEATPDSHRANVKTFVCDLMKKHFSACQRHVNDGRVNFEQCSGQGALSCLELTNAPPDCLFTR